MSSTNQDYNNNGDDAMNEQPSPPGELRAALTPALHGLQLASSESYHQPNGGNDHYQPPAYGYYGQPGHPQVPAPAHQNHAPVYVGPPTGGPSAHPGNYSGPLPPPQWPHSPSSAPGNQAAVPIEEIQCEAIDNSFHKNKGVILAFLNTACNDAIATVGGFRLHLTDIRKVPQYITKYRGLIKQKAIKCFQQHLLDNQSPIGAGENLSVDDFGLTYAIATLSPEAAQLCRPARQEGPLFFCLHPGLIQPAHVGFNEDGSRDYAHIINVYINILSTERRRPNILRRLSEARANPDSTAATAPKRSKQEQSGDRRQFYSQQQRQKDNALAEIVQENRSAMATIVQEVKGLKQEYPPIPAQPPMPWPPARNEIEMPIV